MFCSSLGFVFTGCTAKILPPVEERQTSIQETPEYESRHDQPEEFLSEEDVKPPLSDSDQTKKFIVEENLKAPVSDQKQVLPNKDNQNIDNSGDFETSPKSESPKLSSLNKETSTKPGPVRKEDKENLIPTPAEEESPQVDKEDGLKEDSSKRQEDNSIPFVGKDPLNKKRFEATFPLLHPFKKPEFPLKDIFFNFGKYDLMPLSKMILDKNAGWLRENPEVIIEIQGHCDEPGTSNYNLALGERRAQSTKEYLVALGIAGKRIRTISYGEEKPFCLERAKKCWRQNRRSHFLVSR